MAIIPVPPVSVLVYSKVVNLPVVAVVAPTVPLMLSDAVPVKFVPKNVGAAPLLIFWGKLNVTAPVEAEAIT